MPLVRVIRDRHANPTDRMTWAGFDGERERGETCCKDWTHEFCGTVPQPWPEYRQYESLEELDGADLYDVADLMYPWAQQAVCAHWPGHVVATIWENIPFNYWSVGSAEMLGQVRGFIPRSLTAQRCLEMYGVAPERISLIPAAVDLAQFEPLPRDGLSGERRVLYVGRLVWEKGIGDLSYAQAGQSWRLMLAGEGPSNGPAELGFLGAVSRADMPALMRSADVLVLPSVPVPGWMEQFGVAVIEAMAVGTPVVTTDCGAFREIVPKVHMTYKYDHGFWPIVPAGRWDMLRDTVNALLGDRALWSECSRIVQDRAVHTFGHEVVGAQLRDAYGRFLA